MFIDHIEIKRYRSLYNVTLRPGDLTAVVGPNNSGKTNLVDSIDFLAEAYRYGLEIAVGRKGGFENIAHRKMRRTKSPLAFTVVAVIPVTELRGEVVSAQGISAAGISRNAEIRIRHQFELVARSQAIEANYDVAAEQVVIELLDAHAVTPILNVGRTGTGVSVNSLAAGKGAFMRALVFPFDDAKFVDFLQTSSVFGAAELMVGTRFYNSVLSHFARTMASTRVYQLAPLEGRRPGVPTPNPDLERHGANLPAFVAQLRKNPPVWAAVLQTMRRVVPGLQDIDTDFTPDRRLTLRFHETGVGRPWAPEDVSDGTIQTLGLLAALHDPRASFLLIEEPENAVHPWIIRNFIDACRSVSGKQILLTTHSPALINTLLPTEVLIASRSNGETHLDRLVELDPEAQGLWETGKAKVFEILDTGWLPQAVPGPRQ